MSTVAAEHKLRHQVRVLIPFGRLGRVIAWCEDNMQHNWQFGGESSDWGTNTYSFWFDNPDDASYFTLKWVG